MGQRTPKGKEGRAPQQVARFVFSIAAAAAAAEVDLERVDRSNNHNPFLMELPHGAMSCRAQATRDTLLSE